jgi:hypothetical protein
MAQPECSHLWPFWAAYAAQPLGLLWRHAAFLDLRRSTIRGLRFHIKTLSLRFAADPDRRQGASVEFSPNQVGRISQPMEPHRLANLHFAEAKESHRCR